MLEIHKSVGQIGNLSYLNRLLLKDFLKHILSKTGGQRFAFAQFEGALPILLAFGAQKQGIG